MKPDLKKKKNYSNIYIYREEPYISGFSLFLVWRWGGGKGKKLIKWLLRKVNHSVKIFHMGNFTDVSLELGLEKRQNSNPKNDPKHEMAVLFPSIGVEFLSGWSGMSEYKGQFLAPSNFTSHCQKESQLHVPSGEAVGSTGVVSLTPRPGTGAGMHRSRQDVSSIPADLEN